MTIPLTRKLDLEFLYVISSDNKRFKLRAGNNTSNFVLFAQRNGMI